MDDADRNRRLLYLLLEDRRSKIDPEEFGMSCPSGRGRRPTGGGLAQGQIDDILHTATGTFSRLQRGRLNPSEEYLRKIAELLAMSEEDWNALSLYALGRRPSNPLDPRTDEGLIKSWQALVDDMRHMAYVSGPAWEVLAHNEAFSGMFMSGNAPVNTYEYVLSEESQQTLTDWGRAWAPSFVLQLRTAVAEHPQNRTLQRLVQQTNDHPQASKMFWGDPRSVGDPDGDVRPFNHPKYGRGRAHIHASRLSKIFGARLIIARFVPGDSTDSPALAVYVFVRRDGDVPVTMHRPHADIAAMRHPPPVSGTR